MSSETETPVPIGITLAERSTFDQQTFVNGYKLSLCSSAVRLNDIFLCSKRSKNYSEFCSQSGSCTCKKRDAGVYPDLVADVGQCLCFSFTSKHLLQCHRKQNHVCRPDLFSAVPDIIL